LVALIHVGLSDFVQTVSVAPHADYESVHIHVTSWTRPQTHPKLLLPFGNFLNEHVVVAFLTVVVGVVVAVTVKQEVGIVFGGCFLNSLHAFTGECSHQTDVLRLVDLYFEPIHIHVVQSVVVLVCVLHLEADREVIEVLLELFVLYEKQAIVLQVDFANESFDLLFE